VFASYLILVAVALVALYGFRVALGGRSVFEPAPLDGDF
jgi:hypothetical protein